MDLKAIQDLVRQTVQSVIALRAPDQQVDVNLQTPLLGADSPLDSLGLVQLVVDLEQGLAKAGLHLSLTDEKAMSQKRSPFASIETLAAFIEQRQKEIGS